ncbi:MAG: hypothetical protein IJV14_17585 [Lachnospiraceae bacterium]|nr:hypothetical protein [Lachnospiraceae bacterium]
MEQTLYTPHGDPYFSEPYIDVEEWRDLPVRHYYVHGGFRGTDFDGANEVRFCFYYPEKEKYEGRFFQYVSPAPEDEHESEKLTGEDDKISFCITHGAYYVVSNQGGFVIGKDPSRLYKSSSASAEFSREIAKKLYGTDKRPYGYIFGGSGGSFKTMGAMEATEGIWDGAVPYVMANPIAAPNVFASRMHAVRVLGEDGLKKVVAAMEPGGSGDIYEGLDEIQKAALKEASAMGFPDRAWFCHPFMGDGALMVLVPTVYRLFPQYFTDFWEKEGYEGADPASDAVRDRMRHVTTVTEIIYDIPAAAEEEQFTSVDNSWVNTMLGGEPLPKIRIRDLVPTDSYQFHCRFRVLSGACKGAEINIKEINGDIIELHPQNDGAENINPFKELQPGDEIMIDNSDAIAMQFFHRHQIPDATYKVYDQFRNEQGEPIPAQLPFLIAPIIATSGAGILIDGNIHGKVIGLCSAIDESACPWHGDWYREAVARHGKSDDFRLYYHDNSIHDDRAGYLDDRQRQVDYLGTLHQALLDVAAWAEQGKEPLPTMNYTFADGQITLPAHAGERGGMQPVPFASVNGGRVARVKAGEEVRFEAKIEVNIGSVTGAAWDYERTNDWSHEETLIPGQDGDASIISTHVFAKPGIYYPCLKVKANRFGDASDIFTQCKNLDRVKVIVE